MLNGVVSVCYAIPFALVVWCTLNSSGQGSTSMRSRALVITGAKNCLLSVMVRHCGTRIW